MRSLDSSVRMNLSHSFVESMSVGRMLPYSAPAELQGDGTRGKRSRLPVVPQEIAPVARLVRPRISGATRTRPISPILPDLADESVVAEIFLDRIDARVEQISSSREICDNQ